MLLRRRAQASVRACAGQAAALLAIDGLVYDVTGFEPVHPGGEKILRAYYGKDATRAFKGTSPGSHGHTPVAENLLKEYCVGRLVGEHTEPNRASGVKASGVKAEVKAE